METRNKLVHADRTDRRFKGSLFPRAVVK